MRLPRRVPWASTAELDQLCSWIFADDADFNSRQLAIHRLSAWKAITALPHALESTLALLVASIHDNSSATSSPSTFALRHAYAAAIIRLVNGLVDPLQLGAYARSIAAIAAQLGLPPYLVELRHAATHEELPSIELLREASRQSLTWLLNNYFLPLINPSTAPQSNLAPLRPLFPILKEYKVLLKIITRDTSLRSQYKQDIASVLKSVERWIAEAKVAANVEVDGVGWMEDLPAYEEVDIKERWALRRLCNALLEKGALVPLSKRKRVFPPDAFLPPAFTVQLWAPLLKHIQLLHSDFGVVLANAIISILSGDRVSSSLPGEAPTINSDPSFDFCLARWVMWVVTVSEETSKDSDLRKEVIMKLMQAMGHRIGDSSSGYKAAIILLQSLCADDEKLKTAISFLQHPSSHTPQGWNSENIFVMEERLKALLTAPSIVKDTTMHVPVSLSDVSSIDVVGWRLIDQRSSWKPCPVGVYISG
ncbi:Las1-like-domain-containing protein [Cyathus striatus]|nr:Las1-like-domain-containing protein [Cyathus striatus]